MRMRYNTIGTQRTMLQLLVLVNFEIEIVFSCSSNYLVDLKPFRQGYLTQHKFFTCTCRACEEDWPIFTPIDFQANIALHSCDCFNLLLPVVVITGGANVAYVKEKLKLFISEMQKKEKKLPPSRNYSLTKYALLQCYNVLGNKRRV